MTIDHRHLLKRYMATVIDCESVDYIDHPCGYESIPFTDAEAAELRDISAECSNCDLKVEPQK